jgi:predicted RNase H-like nuclease (RuvC/YqgF family)
MSDNTPETKSPPPARQKLLPGWGQIGDFILNLLRLEGAVDALKKENQELDQRVLTLQRQVDEQAGQLKVLSDFVHKALEESVQRRAEEAAIRALERMVPLIGTESYLAERKED